MDQSSEGEGSSYSRYSIEELVRLRTSAPAVLLNLDKLCVDAETSTILNLPPQTKTNRQFCIRTSELSKLNYRPPLVERASANSTRHRAGNRSLMTSGHDDDEDQVIFRGYPVRKDVRETQWQLRRRDASNRSSQPRDAPTDTLAQKDDNFKAFFQAVRSPTHVRVTAGGRIVPNTRSHPPPQLKWNQGQRGGMSPENDELSMYNQDGGVQLPQSEIRTRGPGGFHTSGSPFIGSHSLALVPATTFDGVTENTPIEPATDAAQASSQPPASHQGIQISAPENFDATRPFWFHDRWVMPGDPAQHQMQGVMHPMYGYMPGVFPQPGMFYPPPNHAMGGMGGQPGMHSGQPIQYAPYPTMMPPPLGNIANGTPAPQPMSGFFGPPFMPPIEDPKVRLARCRDDLRKIDNDLENNVHQIDKPSKLMQRSFCVAEIQRLEVSLGHDVTAQNIRAPSSTKPPGIPVHKGSSSALKSDATDSTVVQRPGVADSSSMSSDPTTNADRISRSMTQSVEQKAKNTPQVQQKNELETTKVLDKSRSRARLAAAAATAVFQPRSQQAAPKLQPPPITEFNSPPPVVRTKEEAEARRLEVEKEMLANAHGDWSLPAGMDSRVSMGPPVAYTHVPARNRPNPPVARKPAMPRNLPMQQLPMLQQPMTQIPVMATQKTYPNTTAAYYMPTTGVGQLGQPHRRAMLPSQQMTGTPYLRGIHHLPSGEFTYERQLTREELLARCAYWGNASRELQHGLIKFDGKDFFPPSPAKVQTQQSNQSRQEARQPADPFRDINYSRANQGLNEDGDDSDFQSQCSWPGKIKGMGSHTDLVPNHTLPKMKATKREERSRFTDQGRAGLEDDQHTVASERQSIGPDKKNNIENKVSSRFLQDMLKYNTGYPDRKEYSSDAFSGNSVSFEGRSSTPLATASMAAPLSGTITSATARGLLPQYRGSATASLAPNAGSPDKTGSDYFGSRLFSRFSSTSDLQDQQALPRPRGKAVGDEENKAAPSRLAAAEYLRNVQMKEQRENQKAPQAVPGHHLQHDSSEMGDGC